MSEFTTPAIMELICPGKWKLVEPFKYHVGSLSSTETIDVPVGFITDLASVPRIFWSILPPFGDYAKAAIIHDYLYDNAIKTKQYADSIFLEAMGVLNVPYWRKYTIYYAVRIFGRGNY